MVNENIFLFWVFIGGIIYIACDFCYYFVRDYLDQRNRNLTPKQAFLVAWRNV